MTNTPRQPLRFPEWLISMRWDSLNPRTAALLAVRLLCLTFGSAGREGDVALGSIEEDVDPVDGLTVHVGNTVLVYLGEDTWEVRPAPNSEEA